ncbi:MAG: hypothetical protein M3Y66_08055 [Actinomycetota bacterium]|nr:hypothetical protein [Actinomycetota bacterium]
MPVKDRRAAASGVTLYTTSKAPVVALQKIAYWGVRLAGARLVPGSTFDASLPCDQIVWERLWAAWAECLGPIDGVAMYQRRQQARSGLTLALTRGGRAQAIVKLRHQDAGLHVEQDALACLSGAEPRHFRVPRALGSGLVDELMWSAQSCVFSRPHSPVLDPPDALFDEVSNLLRPVVECRAETRSTAWAPAHLDLTPWNLRRDHRGQVWLFDWEDVGAAPRGTDQTYFAATLQTVRPGPMPPGLSPAAIRHCRQLVASRVVDNPEDVWFRHTVTAALDRATTAKAPID